MRLQWSVTPRTGCCLTQLRHFSEGTILGMSVRLLLEVWCVGHSMNLGQVGLVGGLWLSVSVSLASLLGRLSALVTVTHVGQHCRHPALFQTELLCYKRHKQ